MTRTVTALRQRIVKNRTDSRTPEQIQHEYYTLHSGRYDDLHVAPDDEHNTSLAFMSALIDGFGYRSILDVGAGTGRGVKHLIERHPGADVRGVEPVRAMIDQAEQANGVPSGVITESGGDPLPYSDNAFDAVCELGVLHHVADPDAIVREMTRVARRAVFLSDMNRFAGGGRARKVAKYALYRAGVWGWVYRLATGGTRYQLTDGDGGVAYSYSVYDSLHVLHEWADRVFLVPVVPSRGGWFHPLFGAPTILVCALRDEVVDAPATAI